MTIYDGVYQVDTDVTQIEGFIEYWLGNECLGARKIGTPSPAEFDRICLTPSDAAWLGLK